MLSVTLLSGLVLILAMIYLVRMITALLDWDFLGSLLPFSPLYLVATGFIWGVAGLVTAIALWRGSKLSAKLTMVFLSLFTIYYWFNRLIMPGFPERNIDWPFIAIFNGILLAWSLWALTRPKAREYFEGADERQDED